MVWGHLHRLVGSPNDVGAEEVTETGSMRKGNLHPPSPWQSWSEHRGHTWPCSLTSTSPGTLPRATGSTHMPVRLHQRRCKWGSHHLWYLQVSAPLTSSLMEPASLRSSRRITSGTSAVPVSRSIWLARLERYSCRSCNKQARCHTWGGGMAANRDTPGCRAPSPCRTAGAC